MTDWLKQGSNAVITGGASGIGLNDAVTIESATAELRQLAD